MLCNGFEHLDFPRIYSDTSAKQTMSANAHWVLGIALHKPDDITDPDHIPQTSAAVDDVSQVTIMPSQIKKKRTNTSNAYVLLCLQEQKIAQAIDSWPRTYWITAYTDT